MESANTAKSVERPETPQPRTLKMRIALWAAAIVALIFVGLLVASFFLNRFLRPRLEARMNNSLKGYHVSLGSADVGLLTLRLTLHRLTIVQNAHPAPPVAEFPLMRFHIHWRALLSGHVVATVGIWNPSVHINRPQLLTEARNKTPLRERGWQDALEAVYPFDINRLSIHMGDIVYIDEKNAKPLHLARLNFVTDNIRNLGEPNNVYPSTFSGSTSVFDTGFLEVTGRANYLMKPYPGLVTDYVIKGAPLRSLTPASQHVNLLITDGILASDGSVEYSPKVTNVKVRKATIASVDLTYVHLPETNGIEKERISNVGKTVEKENNRPAVNLDVQELDLPDGRLTFKNEDSHEPYSLFLTNTNVTIKNLSNHKEHGLSHLDLTGKFMGSGATRVYGTFVAGGGGPEFASNLEVVNTDLTTLNPLLRAYGRLDVAHGHLTVYSQINVKDSRITGYVKPMFSDVKVYGYAKDKNKGVLQQAKNVVVGAAAHILKNSRTQQVASQVSLAGNLKNPSVSTWQAFVEVVRNAFVQAILPGFDRNIGTDGNKAP